MSERTNEEFIDEEENEEFEDDELTFIDSEHKKEKAKKGSIEQAKNKTRKQLKREFTTQIPDCIYLTNSKMEKIDVNDVKPCFVCNSKSIKKVIVRSKDGFKLNDYHVCSKHIYLFEKQCSNKQIEFAIAPCQLICSQVFCNKYSDNKSGDFSGSMLEVKDMNCIYQRILSVSELPKESNELCSICGKKASYLAEYNANPIEKQSIDKRLKEYLCDIHAEFDIGCVNLGVPSLIAPCLIFNQKNICNLYSESHSP